MSRYDAMVEEAIELLFSSPNQLETLKDYKGGINSKDDYIRVVGRYLIGAFSGINEARVYVPSTTSASTFDKFLRRLVEGVSRELGKEEFIKDGYSLVNRLLEHDPKDFAKVNEVLNDPNLSTDEKFRKLDEYVELII